MAELGSTAAMSPVSSHRLQIEPARMAPGWLITPRSYLADRIVPACEDIRLPAKSFGGGALSFEIGEVTTRSSMNRGLKGHLKRLAPTTRIEDGVIVDLRRNNPKNWAHILTNHLPICFIIAVKLGLHPSEMRPVLPRRTPIHIRRATELFGFSPILSDDALQGRGIRFEVKPWIGIRSARHIWVQTPFVRQALARARLDAPSERPLPSRVFISRRDARRLVNEAEIAKLLSAEGFEMLYAEDLSVIEQFRLFARAETIVAIHGAGLAPLLYRSPSALPATVVELFPCGHVTDVWRAVCGQTGCRWIGVRGKIRPEHLRHAYDLRRPFLRYSLQDFEVDPVSVKRSLSGENFDNVMGEA